MPYLTKEVEIIQDQDSISRKSTTACEPFLFEEATYDFIIEIRDENAQARAFSMIISGKKPADKPKRIGSTNAYTSQINFGSQIGYVDLEFFLEQ